MPDRKKRRHSHIWGMIAEFLCAFLLIFKGYTILSMRYRNYGGEIDIIALKGKVIAFIEVKARKTQDAALYSVTPAKQKILARAAESFIAVHPKYAYHGLRFDVMVVTSFFTITHLKSAWRM